MVMGNTVEGKYFSDTEVEELFRVSHSKLRTAQRFGLVESASGLHQGRYIRMWSEVDAIKSALANLMSESLAVPFAACCCVLELFYRRNPGAELLHEFAATNVYPGEGNFRELWSRHPVIVTANRHVVLLMTGDEMEVLGRLQPDDAGRLTFHEDPAEAPPAVDRTEGWSAFSPVVATAKLVKLADDA